MDKRPGLQQAIDDACQRGCVLVVYSLSRLARNTRETLELGERFAKAGADIVSLSENIDTTSAAGKMVFRMLAVLAEFERDQVSERTSMAMAHKRSQGHRISRHIPYGKSLSADGLHLEAHGAEQAVIAVAKDLHLSGLSTRTIAARLAEQGLRSRAGTVFAPSAITAMVGT
jgi:DNA invertase Pin-like site-specific DNA recombinase